MALVRQITVGFRGPNNKIERVTESVPADWVSGDRDALHEIYNNQKIRTRIAVEPGTALWAQISDPFDNDNVGFVI